MALKLTVDRICTKCGKENVKDDEDGIHIRVGHECPYGIPRNLDGIPRPTYRPLKKANTIIKEASNGE